MKDSFACHKGQIGWSQNNLKNCSVSFLRDLYIPFTKNESLLNVRTVYYFGSHCSLHLVPIFSIKCYLFFSSILILSLFSAFTSLVSIENKCSRRVSGYEERYTSSSSINNVDPFRNPKAIQVTVEHTQVRHRNMGPIPANLNMAGIQVAIKVGEEVFLEKRWELVEAFSVPRQWWVKIVSKAVK